MSTICTIVVGVVGLLMVYRTCKPFNYLRKLLMATCVVAFLFCIVVLRPIFTLNLNLSTGGWLVLAVFVLLAFEVSLSANVIVDVVNKAVRWVQRRSRKLFD